MAAVSCGSDSAGEHRPQLRLLLLGAPRAGKSCSGNTILGEEVFQTGEETVHSMVIYKEGRGRRLTVVDTPPWACPSDSTAGGDGADGDGGGDDDGGVEGGGGGDADGAAVQSEQASIEGPFMGAILCPPGPHALLLVMSASQPFTEVHRRAAEDQVEALGGGAWRHCMLIFTGVDQLPKGTFVEEYIENTGEALQWLVERCGSRYHALDNTLKGGKEDTQVQELLEKVEELVEENQGWYFEFNELTLLEEEHARKALEEERRRMEEQERLRPSMVGGPPRELRVLLLGWKGVGKSSVGNAILGRRDFESGMETELCMRRQALVHGRRVTVVDTPGWDWFSVRRTPRRIRQEIKRGGALLYPGPHSILLVLPVVCSLSTRKRRTLEAHIDALFGDKACLHTMLLFSCGDWLGRTPIEEHIQRGGRELHSLLEYCGNYYHVMDSKTPVKDSRSVSDLLDKIEEMSRENGDEAFLPIPMNSDSESSDNTSPEDDCRGCQLQ